MNHTNYTFSMCQLLTLVERVPISTSLQTIRMLLKVTPIEDCLVCRKRRVQSGVTHVEIFLKTSIAAVENSKNAYFNNMWWQMTFTSLVNFVPYTDNKQNFVLLNNHLTVFGCHYYQTFKIMPSKSILILLKTRVMDCK